MASNEIWRPVKNYEIFYEVSNKGRVRSLPKTIYYSDGRAYAYKSRIIKPSEGNHGYLMIKLTENKKSKSFLIHRLVAEAFISNPLTHRTANHKDGIKTNNDLFNLEWATDSENMYHAYQNGLNHNGDETLKTGKECKAFKRAIQADNKGIGCVMFGNKQMKKFGFDPVGICRCLKGLRRTHRNCVISAIEVSV